MNRWIATDVRPVDQLNVEELQRERAQLQVELSELDGELASKRNDLEVRRIKRDEYFEWRAGAVQRKSEMTRRLLLLRAELDTRAQTVRDERHDERAKRHRQKAHRLRMCVEQVKDLSEDKSEEPQALLRSIYLLARDTLLADANS